MESGRRFFLCSFCKLWKGALMWGYFLNSKKNGFFDKRIELKTSFQLNKHEYFLNSLSCTVTSMFQLDDRMLKYPFLVWLIATELFFKKKYGTLHFLWFKCVSFLVRQISFVKKIKFPFVFLSIPTSNTPSTFVGYSKQNYNY